jgi:hypothetical protein
MKSPSLSIVTARINSLGDSLSKNATIGEELWPPFTVSMNMLLS